MNQDESCASCKCFYQSGVGPNLQRDTLCRRQRLGQLLPGPGGQPVTVGFYPPTSPNMWCLSWTRKDLVQ